MHTHNTINGLSPGGTGGIPRRRGWDGEDGRRRRKGGERREEKRREERGEEEKRREESKVCAVLEAHARVEHGDASSRDCGIRPAKQAWDLKPRYDPFCDPLRQQIA